MAKMGKSKSRTDRKKTVLTIVGFHDPYYTGTLADEGLKGPILYLVGLKRFDAVILFATPNLVYRTQATSTAILEEHPETRFDVWCMKKDWPFLHLRN